MLRVASTSVSSVRLRARAPRVLLLAVIAVFSIAGVRAALRSPAPAVTRVTSSTGSDVAVEAFAESFTRAYLTWEPGAAASRERNLRSMLSASLEPGGGVELPTTARQRVLWTTVERSVPRGRARNVVVRATTTRGDLHLGVTVARGPRGGLAVVDYPALVGPPAMDPQTGDAARDEVDDDRLRVVSRRVVTNFLARARENLAADLTGGGVVVLPTEPLRVLSVEAVEWARRSSRVAVTVRARARDGVRLTLTYELRVVRRAGRWLVSGMPSMSSPKESP